LAFLLLFEVIGQEGAYWAVPGLSVLGAGVTYALVPETSGVSLEAIAETS
jgi:hypothetical protein